MESKLAIKPAWLGVVKSILVIWFALQSIVYLGLMCWAEYLFARVCWWVDTWDFWTILGVVVIGLLLAEAFLFYLFSSAYTVKAILNGRSRIIWWLYCVYTCLSWTLSGFTDGSKFSLVRGAVWRLLPIINSIWLLAALMIAFKTWRASKIQSK
ncbi:MAG: hypothetical protein LUD17_04380 [Bacteroidales bacterium]|nr:hypothetical protein [Bacteroidales bacterium]